MESPHYGISFVLVVWNRQVQRIRKYTVGYQRIREKGREEMVEVAWLRRQYIM